MAMKEEKISFYSDGLKLEGAFYAAENRDPKKPVVIVCSGFTGMRNIHPERYARNLTPHGFTCFGFDYRTFPPSEGAVGFVHVEEQIRDIVNATHFVQANLAGRGSGIVLAGWGMAGGMVLEAARLSPSLRGLVAMNGFYDAVRVQKALRGDAGYSEFLRWLADKRSAAVRTKDVPLVDCFDIYPLDAKSRTYVDNVLRKSPGYRGDTVRLSFADSLLGFAPERRLEHLSNIPLLIAHGDENLLHPVAEAEALYRAYPGPKELFLIKGGGHTEWMLDEHPIFQSWAKKLASWVGDLN